MSSNTISCLVTFNASLTNFFKISHPRLGELMEYNARGTLQLLHDYNAAIIENEPWQNAINAFAFQLPMDIPHTGNDNLKTWKEFKSEITKFILGFCKKSQLKSYSAEIFNDAIKVLSQHLWDEYYRKYPRWPAVGSENAGHVRIFITHMYSNQGTTIVWNCDGDVWVQDTRPDGAYRAYLSGSPEIKVILVKNSLLNSLEATMNVLCLEDAKRKVDEKLKQLSWQQL